MPGISIATDIICGFPTETEKDFDSTLEMCAKHRFPSLFINQFFPRPGTPAARMERVATTKQVLILMTAICPVIRCWFRFQVKNRTKRLSELFKSYQPYDDQVGQRQSVLVTDISHDKQYFVAHNKQYAQVKEFSIDWSTSFSCFYLIIKVLVPMKPEYMGKMVDVLIVSASKFSLMSEPLTVPVRPDVPEALEKGQVSGLPTMSEPPVVQQPRHSINWWPLLGLSVVIGLRLGWIFVWRRR